MFCLRVIIIEGKKERDFFYDIDKLIKGFMMEEYVMWFNYIMFW